MNTIVAYVPVLHEGYLQFFRKYAPARVYILSKELTQGFRSLIKDIRALDPHLVCKAVKAWQIPAFVANAESLKKLNAHGGCVILPDEDVTKAVAQEYLPECRHVFSTIFLRWDTNRSKAGFIVEEDSVISKTDFDCEMMKLAFITADASSDFWRRVGAVLVKNGRVLATAFNRHVPYSQMPYINGDPRGNFSKGINLELSTAIHAEAAVIASVAGQDGVSCKGADIYSSTFPCPPCAKLIAYSGIKRCFFSEGYNVLDAQTILASQGIEIIRVL